MRHVRLHCLILATLFTGFANANVALSFRPNDPAFCDVTPLVQGSQCTSGQALPGSVALLPLSASITFTEASVAAGHATFSDIVAFSISAGNRFNYGLADFQVVQINPRVEFSADRHAIAGFYAEALISSTPPYEYEPRDRWMFGTRLQNGAKLDALDLMADRVVALNDVIDPSTGEIVRLGAAGQKGRAWDEAYSATVPEPMSLALAGVALAGLAATWRRERRVRS